MDFTRVAILGGGSVRCAVPVLASLATYFGERPLEIRMYDADLERLDLFDRFARVCFLMTKSTHKLVSTTIFAEAVEDVDKVILEVGGNCAHKFLRETRRMGIATLERTAMVEQATEEMLGFIPPEAQILSLQGPEVDIPRDHYRLDWPPPVAVESRPGVPHQVLRWVRGEEYLHELLAEHERSPLKAWLDDPESATSVTGRPVSNHVD